MEQMKFAKTFLILAVIVEANHIRPGMADLSAGLPTGALAEAAALAKADDSDAQIQMLEMKIANQEKELSDKQTVLEDCRKKTKGWKIAGISTLAATGIGVAANIALKSKLDGMGSKGGGGENMDTRPQSEKNTESCSLLCEVGAAPDICMC